MKAKRNDLFKVITGNEDLLPENQDTVHPLEVEIRSVSAENETQLALDEIEKLESTQEKEEILLEELEETVAGIEMLMGQSKRDMLTVGLLYAKADKLHCKLGGNSTLPKGGMESLTENNIEAYVIVGQEGFMDTLKSGAKRVKDFIVKLYQMVRDWIKSFFTGSNNNAEIAKESAEIAANIEHEVARLQQSINDINEVNNLLDDKEDRSIKVDKRLEEAMGRLREVKSLPEFKVGTFITPKEREAVQKKLKGINLKTLAEDITSPRKVSKSKFLNNPNPIKSLNLLPNEIRLGSWDQFIALEEGPNSPTVKTLMSIINAISEVDFPIISSLVTGSGGRPSDWKPLIKIIEQLNKLFGLLKSISGAKVSNGRIQYTQVVKIDINKGLIFEFHWPDKLYEELISKDLEPLEFWSRFRYLLSRTAVNLSRGQYKPGVIRNPCTDYNAVNKLVSSRAEVIKGSDKPVTTIVNRQKAFFRDGAETTIVKKLDFLEATLREQPKEYDRENTKILGDIENSVSDLSSRVKIVYGVGIQIHEALGKSLKAMTKELTRVDLKKLEESDEFKKFNEMMTSSEPMKF